MNMKLKTITVVLYVFSWLLLSSCQPSNQLYQSDSLYVFGTLVKVSIWGVPELQARAAVNTVAQELQRLHQEWHAWQPSPLTELNQAFATGQSRQVTAPTLLSLVEQAKFFYKLTDGLFNPAIGRLIELWGFHQDEMPVGPPPEAADIAKLVALAPTMEDVMIDGNQVSSKNPAVQLDFGGIGKGYAVDLAINRLRQLGIQNAIVNAGGNLKVMGKKGKHPWLIGIRHPSGQGVLAAVTASGEESVITSGNYERYREYQGQHYSHILDPRNGMPAQTLTSVTVIACSGTLADVATTALSVAGLSDWYRIAKQMGLKLVMLVDNQGTVYLSPAMAERVKFESNQSPTVVLSEPL